MSAKEKTYLVYKLTNTRNNKFYFGQTGNFNDRMSGHKNGNKNKNTVISLAIKKYGWNNFIVEIIKNNLTVNEIDAAEIFYINYFDATNPKIGYNRAKGGRVNRGWKMPDNQKKEIGNRHRGTKSAKSNLSEQDVLDIRKSFINLEFSIKELSSKYKLSTRNISGLVKNKTYYDPDYTLTSNFLEKYNLHCEENHRLSITRSDFPIIEIRNKYLSACFTIKQLSNQYNTDVKTMSKIIYNKTHIDKNYLFSDEIKDKINKLIFKNTRKFTQKPFRDNQGNIFHTAYEAALYYECSESKIRHSLKGRTKTGEFSNMFNYL